MKKPKKERCRAITSNGKRCKRLTAVRRSWGGKYYPCCKEHPLHFWLSNGPHGLSKANPYLKQKAEIEEKVRAIRSQIHCAEMNLEDAKKRFAELTVEAAKKVIDTENEVMILKNELSPWEHKWREVVWALPIGGESD